LLCRLEVFLLPDIGHCDRLQWPCSSGGEQAH
jgi:hypothetical protein